jgi:predicted pyridoxine 5'-phosphate oxidase superfamily flavin-nucleotide-binding protein
MTAGMDGTQPDGGLGLFHEGERGVQRRAGVEQIAAQVGRHILPYVPAEFGAFLRGLGFVVVAGEDDSGRIWASLVVGDAGFARALDDRHVLLSVRPARQDPLRSALSMRRARIGVLAIEPATRRRIRLNGVAELSDAGILVTVAEAYGNCAKYIQRRIPAGPPLASPAAAAAATTSAGEGEALVAHQAALVRGADTFFIASSHPERGADASHRGGRPGFVRVSADGRTLTFPDYIGNRMFQTLGNLTVDPRAGLLLVNWGTGSTLQVTGRAQIGWDPGGSWPGAERLVVFTVDGVLECERVLPQHWNLIEPFARNPPVSHV